MKITKLKDRLHISNEVNKELIEIIKSDIKNPFSLQIINSDYKIGIECEFYIPNKGTTANEKMDNMGEQTDRLLHQLSFFNKEIVVLNDSFEDDKILDFAYLEKDTSLESKLGEGFEFVSPKMDIRDVPFYFQSVSDIINDIGYSNDSCGVHFHISSDKLKNIDMAKLMTFLHAENNLFEEYMERNDYVKSLEKVFLNMKVENFNKDVREQTKNYDIVFLANNHIELRIFGGANVYKDAENILNKLNTFIELHRIACMPNAEQELYGKLVKENLSNGHHTMEKANLNDLMTLAGELKEKFGYSLESAFDDAFNNYEEVTIVPEEHYYNAPTEQAIS